MFPLRRTGPQAAARAQRVMQAGEQPLVVEDPVEGGRGDQEVGRLVHLQLEEVAWRTATRRPGPRAGATPPPPCAPSRPRPARCPRGRRSANRRVTRPVPQPASIARSSPSSGMRSTTRRPQASCGSETRW